MASEMAKLITHRIVPNLNKRGKISQHGKEQCDNTLHNLSDMLTFVTAVEKRIPECFVEHTISRKGSSQASGGKSAPAECNNLFTNVIFTETGLATLFTECPTLKARFEALYECSGEGGDEGDGSEEESEEDSDEDNKNDKTYDEKMHR